MTSPNRWTLHLPTDTSREDDSVGAHPQNRWTKGDGEALLKLDGKPVAVICRAGYTTREEALRLAEGIVAALNAYGYPDVALIRNTDIHAEELHEQAAVEVERLRSMGWTPADFARALKELLESGAGACRAPAAP